VCTQEAFRTERAQRAGMANASSGRIMVTCAGDHFGPILAEHDPERGLVSKAPTALHARSRHEVHTCQDHVKLICKASLLTAELPYLCCTLSRAL